MYKIIGADQKEYGPSSAEELQQWVREGRADGRSLVREEDGTEWKPLASFPELASALGASPFASGPPPLMPPPRPVDSATEVAQILAAASDLQVGVCLRRGWELLMSNFGLLFFAAVTVFMIQTMFARIPLIGVLALLCAGVFQGGVYQLFLKQKRGQPARFADAFSGFGEHFVQLLLVGIISAVLRFAGYCACILPGIYLLVAWTFAVPLVMDKQLRFWDALELSRKVVSRCWFQLFLLLIIAYLPAILISGVVGVVNMTFFYSLVHSGQLDPSLFSTDTAAYLAQVQKAEQLSTEKFFVLQLFNYLVWAIVQPFAKAVLVQAYEILFNPRTTPSA